MQNYVRLHSSVSHSGDCVNIISGVVRKEEEEEYGGGGVVCCNFHFWLREAQFDFYGRPLGGS